MIVYLSGPINDVTREQATVWRKAAAEWLKSRNICSFDPAGAWSVPDSLSPFYGEAKSIADIDRAAILASDIVLVNMTGQWGLGTLREIEWARIHNKPVIIWSDREIKSMWAHDLRIFGSMDTALQAVKHIADGNK